MKIDFWAPSIHGLACKNTEEYLSKLINTHHQQKTYKAQYKWIILYGHYPVHTYENVWALLYTIFPF